MCLYICTTMYLHSHICVHKYNTCLLIFWLSNLVYLALSQRFMQIVKTGKPQKINLPSLLSMRNGKM